ncbi:hypothetical protein AU184_11095 [Mycolicibacterium novocastrense]|uniref:Uncharacterized protein n=1 Tax=Mycolicibacterium novocastrense TaxID=59813 RepID=A0AAW5SMF6_MYCNV|nr:DUF6390 family protein [Mycolicibacterium novocastrense]KUH66927.1 hypothetical protein AU072_27225 [Mycolicibacterium novocastrense]KUH70628.1 hypothetical protein AU184_11095 [Mycolicibacterium novocastrense]KUH78990.1 hypothetical protein AU183_03185 [Mycolicibacterium novocastrense]MCV7024238.1 hypothetical protein [Mycolicibacterium novocastrense]GAT09859.1 uncharacterized protein RMCN_2992 [Mycolicibacterium novocastrense]
MNDRDGSTLFGRYAYPPNELGYCGPADCGGASGLASHAREFDGAWPYLTAIAEAVGASDAMADEVIGSYWIGGPALSKVDPDHLLARLRASFTGQVTGMLGTVPATSDVLAHHSFHVFVVYPWVKFLGRDADTAVGVMQACRIRWGTVTSVTGDRAEIASRPLQYEDGRLMLGDSRTERISWKRGEVSLAPVPQPGAVVSAHWNWICGTLTEEEAADLEVATQTTLDLVNSVLGQGVSP